MLTRLRRGSDQQFVPRSEAGRALLFALREGRSVGLLLDQNTTPAQGDEFVDLFGLPVPAPTVAARLARRSGAPIVPLFCVPAPRGRYLVYSRPFRFAGDLCDPQAAGADTRVTQWIITQFEEEIRRHPGSWLWSFRRWRYIPFGAVSFFKYPYYADTVIMPKITQNTQHYKSLWAITSPFRLKFSASRTDHTKP